MNANYNPIVSIPCLVLCFCMIGSFCGYAQNPECAADQIHLHKMNTDHNFKQKQQNVEKATYSYVLPRLKPSPQLIHGADCELGEEQAYKIPVVVHVMHLPGDAVGSVSNPSDAQVQAGIDHLNDAFRNRGHYAGGPYHTTAKNLGITSQDIKIEFHLAKRDPNGNSTSGINRVSTSYSNLFYNDPGPNGFPDQDEYLKSLSFWDSKNYANVWLVNEICRESPSSGCGVAGYAYLAGAHGANYDGVVNEARFWGTSQNNSKVHIHEFGHYLNLYHTFNDPDGGGAKTGCNNNDCLNEGDYVCDTPPDASSSATSCSSSSTNNSCSTDADDTSSNNPFTSDVEDMYENYMDYGFQSCQNTYTNGQKLRMRAALENIRASLLDSDGLIPISTIDAAISEILGPDGTVGCAEISPVIVLSNVGSNTLSSAKIKYTLDGQFKQEESWTGSLTTGNSDTISLTSISTTSGTHSIQVYLSEVNGQSGDEYVDNDSLKNCFEIYTPISSAPYCQDLESAAFPPPNWSIDNPLSGPYWGSWQAGTGCSSGNGSGTFYLRSWKNYTSQDGAEQHIWMPSFDLTNFASASLTFDYAYQRSYSNRGLELEVAISTDCGATYSVLDYKNNTSLATKAGTQTSGAWVPITCNDWESETLDLTAYVGQEVSIRFKAKVLEFYSQNLYLDNICVDGIVSNPCDLLEVSIEHTDEICQQANGSAIASPTGGSTPYVYTWNTSPIQTTQSISNLSAGNYQLILVDSMGCADTTIAIIANQSIAPKTDFSTSTTSLTSTFTDASLGANSWLWDFGDGNVSTTQNPTHTYAVAGTYTVCLTSSNSCGTDSLCKSITVECTLPNMDFRYTIDGMNISFGYTGEIGVLYSWDFGDGTTVAGNISTHTYANPGNYRVCLYGTNVCGTDSACQIVTIECPAPSANFSYSRDELKVSFINTISSGAEYAWDFGDGNFISGSDPTHVYINPGSYVVCLTATDSCGTESMCDTLVVSCALPLVGFDYVQDGLIVSFTNTSTPNAKYKWDFGDGTSSDQFEPFHSYLTPGQYTVGLSVSTNCGTDSLITSIDIITTSIHTEIEELDVKLYPNPSRGKLLLEIFETDRMQISWELTDLRGRSVKQSSFFSNNSIVKETIDLSKEAEGAYILKIWAGNKQYIRKIRVEK